MRFFPFLGITIVAAILVVSLVFLGLGWGLPNWAIDLKAQYMNQLSGWFAQVEYNFTHYETLQKLRAENQLLKMESRTKDILINRQKDILLENTRLKKLLQISAPKRGRWLTAEVVSHQPDLWTYQLVINKGKQDGIRKHATVINEDGLVGLVYQVGEHAATIRLITHPQIKISARNVETGEIALLQGTGQKELKVDLVDQNSKVSSGQVFMTSGQSQLFPKSIYIGQVEVLESDPHLLFKNLKLIPGMDVDRLDYVLVQR